MGFHVFGHPQPHIMTVSPGYFTDCWTTPGHLGADPASSAHRDRVRHRRATVGPPHGGVDDAAVATRSGHRPHFQGIRDGQLRELTSLSLALEAVRPSVA